jgi:phosphinothricin acetyltransferase
MSEATGLAAAAVIEPAAAVDLPELVSLYNHYILQTAATFDIEPYTVEARRAWFAQFGATGRHRLLVARTAAESVAAFAASAPFRPKQAYETSVEVSIYCAPGAAGRGLASALYHELFARLAEEDVHRAYAGVTLPNDASVALHRKFGFADLAVYHEVGRKLGRYWDVLWLEKKF